MIGEATAAQKLDIVKAQVAQMNAMIAEEKPLGTARSALKKV